MNAVGKNIFSYYPDPNTAGDPVTGINNFVSNASRTINKDQINARVDHQITAMQKIFARVSSDATDLCQPDTYGNPATPGAGSVGCTTFQSRSATLEHDYTISPSLLLTVRYGFARWYQNRFGRSYGFDQKSLGFPTSLINLQQVPIFPTVNVNGYSALGTQGNNFLNNGNDTHSLLPSLAIIRGPPVGAARRWLLPARQLPGGTALPAVPHPRGHGRRIVPAIRAGGRGQRGTGSGHPVAGANI